MTKRMWFLLGVVLCIWVCLFPIVVFGEATYEVLPSDECLIVCNSIETRPSYQRVIIQSEYEVRGVWCKYSDDYYFYVNVSEHPFKYYNSWAQSNTCPATHSWNNAGSGLYGESQTRYYVKLVYPPYLRNIENFSSPVININEPFSDQDNARAWGVYYTFGEGASEPLPEPVNWGLLRNVEYGTRVAGNGEASRQNIDYLSWDTLLDTNGNDISECEVEIRAVYGKWTGNTAEDVMGLDYQDLAISGNVTLATLDASVGGYSVRWQDVVNALNSWDFEDLSTHAVNNQIEKNGWYYQIMLLPPDGIQGQWQTVYTPLSSSAQSSEIVLNHNSFDMSVNQVYQQLTQINNTTSININIEGSDYTIQNPDDGEEPETVEDWDIFKQILNAIFQTIKAITSLPAKIAEKLLDNAQLLLTPPASYDGSLAQRFDQEYEEYMSTKQQTIYDFLEGVKDLEPYINQRIPANQGAHECIITWEDVTMDLTPFGVGQVTFINGGTHNLTTTFLQMLGGFGLTYADYEGLVTGFLYLAMAAFIYKKFVIFLRKS